MIVKEIADGIYFMGAMHWDRRIFDELISLPDGTSYNAYLIKDEKVALIDTVDPSKEDELLKELEKMDIERIDYIISHHTEQDHSGGIPAVMEKYKEARVIASKLGKELLKEHLLIPENKIKDVDDGEALSLGKRNLQFISAPWVHWPETMLSYLKEDKILFTCDLFGSHLATSRIYADENPRIYEAAKRYYAEIMMPFRKKIRKHLDRIRNMEIKMIAPSHGPIYRKPETILNAYEEWISDEVKKEVVVAYVSMHGSVEKMVKHFIKALEKNDMSYKLFNLPVTDIGELAMTLVDASTLVLATPTVLGGMHPLALYAFYLANALNPKTKFVSLIISYGWGGKAVEQAKSLFKLKAEIIEPVIAKGHPKQEDYEALNRLAEEIAKKHNEAGIT
ncbi:MAG: FprA family A-type flavoprotein [Thermoplasmata archaeon]|nr:FprA family A-type flavoprotein [Thermoplasmata archaeon]